MKNFVINGHNILAIDKDEAESIASMLKFSSQDCIFFRYDDGTIQVVNLKDQSCAVFSKHGKDVSRVGRIVRGSGQKIIQAAVNQVDNSHKLSAKMRKNTRRANRIAKEEEFLSIIKAFEDKVPENAKQDFDDIVKSICKDSVIYRVEMYQQIDNSIDLNHNNWFNILSWYRPHVLESNSTLFEKRKAFVTTVCRMGEQDCQIGNTIQGAVAENDENFWSKFVDEESSRSVEDS